MIYRVLTKLRLSSGVIITEGTVSSLLEISPRGKQGLLSKGAISKVRSPPLHILPGWTTRADQFEQEGITDAATFLCADLLALSEKMNIPHRVLQSYATDVLRHLTKGV